MIYRFQKYTLLYLSILLVILTSSSACHNSFNECLSGSGKTKTERMGLYSFRNVCVMDNINLTIENGDEFELEITTGENIIPMLGIEIQNNTLTLSNESTCLVLKDPWTNIDMKLIVPQLDTIFLQSHGSLVSSVPFESESLLISLTDTPAKVDLQVGCGFLRIENLSGTADVKISGNVSRAECYHSAYGKIDFTGLYAEFMNLNVQSSNDTYIWGGTEYFYVAIGDIGNVYYYNQAKLMEVISESSGELIKVTK